jgi:hypothetical protein
VRFTPGAVGLLDMDLAVNESGPGDPVLLGHGFAVPSAVAGIANCLIPYE